jgi:DNA (cytosine-5)-methyltransferase 1
MSAARHYLRSDEDDEGVNDSDNDLELLDFGESKSSFALQPELIPGADFDTSEPEIVSVTARRTSSSSRTPEQNSPAIKLPDTELKRYKLGKGCVIAPGHTVELKDGSAHSDDAMHSADFFRIKHIILNLQTDKVRIRGHRLRRTKYLDQIFDCELFSCNVFY